MRHILALLLALVVFQALAADYPSLSLEKLLSKEEQDQLGVSSMTNEQREVLRRTVIGAFRAGFEKGKEEGVKAAVRAQSIPNVVESQIDGDFEGWEGETIVKLMNGQIWQQSDYRYEYHYAFMPDVVIYKSGGGYKMKVEGVDEAVGVVQLK